ncbi:MAG: hypothetical protein IJ305_02090 [Oscillospiraceae bacterium]|nr:hypothetical protein [Oscillospiraceae bacterium]
MINLNLTRRLLMEKIWTEMYEAAKSVLNERRISEYVTCGEVSAAVCSKSGNASYFGRIFARSGGLSDAVAQGLKEQNIDFELKAVTCDGIEECRTALLKKSKNVLDGNFIEGMACIGGCIGGAGCLTHGMKDKAEVDKYGREAFEKTITDAVSILK